MGDVVDMRRTPPRPSRPQGPRRSVSLREELRRAELVAALIADCRRRLSDTDMTCVISSTPKGAPVWERIWGVAIVDATGRSHPFFHPVHSDDLDMFAGAVRAGLQHWRDVVVRRGSMRAIVDGRD